MSKVKTRRATEADRKAALDALERASIPANDVATELDTYPEKWTLKHCRAAMLKAGMTDEDIDAVFAANAPTTSEGQEAQQSDADAAPQPLESSPSDPGHPLHICPTCADWGGEEVGCDSGCYGTCSTRDPEGGTQDHWRPSDERRCETCSFEGKEEHVDECEQCFDALDNGQHLPSWKPAHPAFSLLADAAPAPHRDSKGDAPDLLTCPPNLHKMGKELVTVTQKLTDAERIDLAGVMADALQRRDALDEEFASVKRSYKAKIDLAVEDAATAGAEYRSGERTHTLMCEKYEDKSTLEIVYLEPGTGREVSRRKMTDDDRRLKLPMEAAAPPAIGTTEPTPDNARSCINCVNMAQGDVEMPEPCQTCSQCGNGVADNWEAKRLCATCTNCTTRVNLYPCNGCSLNADEEHRGDDDRWTWKEFAPELTADATDEQLAATDETEGMSTAEEDTPTQGVAHGEDDMPTCDDTAADDMPAMPTVQPAEDMPTVRQ